MFTGIVQAVGTVSAVERDAADARLHIDVADLPLDDVAIGDSIAVDGACLTVVALADGGFRSDVSGETLARTTLGKLAPGARVNLEKSLTPSTALGGHLVSGHVDGQGRLIERRPDGRSERLRVRVPRDLRRYVATKGSVCVNGVSLTVNETSGDDFSVNIIPHTLERTTLGALQPDDEVNIEVDVIARYLERLLEERLPGGGS